MTTPNLFTPPLTKNNYSKNSVQRKRRRLQREHLKSSLQKTHMSKPTQECRIQEDQAGLGDMHMHNFKGNPDHSEATPQPFLEKRQQVSGSKRFVGGHRGEAFQARFPRARQQPHLPPRGTKVPSLQQEPRGWKLPRLDMERVRITTRILRENPNISSCFPGEWFTSTYPGRLVEAGERNRSRPRSANSQQLPEAVIQVPLSRQAPRELEEAGAINKQQCGVQLGGG